MKNKIILFISISTSLFFACHSSKKSVKDNSGTTNEVTYRELGYQKYKNDTIFNFSIGKSYVLCQKSIKETNLNPNVLTDFFVFDLKKNIIIYEDKIAGCEISWYSDFELYIIKQKGIIITTEDSGKNIFLFNVITHEQSNFKKQLNIINNY